jgi:hypothetical protein
MKRIWKISGALLVLAILFTGFMGFAHTRSGRPVLVWLGNVTGKHQVCPLGFDKVASLAERDQIRKKESLVLAKLPAAKNRDAFQFEIGKSTRADFIRWVNSQSGACHEHQANYQLECAGSFFSTQSTTLWVEFDSHDTLMSLRGIEKFGQPNAALEFYKGLAGRLEKPIGKSTKYSGIADRPFLDSGLLAQASIQQRFNNFQASIRITNMGKEFAVTQNFRGY